MGFKRNLVPVLLGGDLNAYSVALSFKHSFNINSHVFTSYRCGATECSRFITTHQCSGLRDSNIALPELLSFAAKHTGSCLLLIPCSDMYLEMLYDIHEPLSDFYNVIIPKKSDYRMLADKASFYKLLKSHKIPYPEYCVINTPDVQKIREIKIGYPAVLKPSCSAEYAELDFKGKKKIYFPKSEDEAVEIADLIFKKNYEGALILQKKLPENAQSFVLTCLSNIDGTVARAVRSKVMMLERTDTGYGNYSALLTCPLDEISNKIIEMLNKISYVGIANFDIMYSVGKPYCLEANLRQGRSCDYLRAAGVNLAEYFYKNAVEMQNLTPNLSFKEIFWHYPSKRTALKNLEDTGEYGKVIDLIKNGRSFSPFENPYEGISKRLYSKIHDMRVSLRLSKMKRGRI
jgi:D-aspartate ligase